LIETRVDSGDDNTQRKRPGSAILCAMLIISLMVLWFLYSERVFRKLVATRTEFCDYVTRSDTYSGGTLKNGAAILAAFVHQSLDHCLVYPRKALGLASSVLPQFVPGCIALM